ncbi:MAG: NAD-dependent epimerase/dehydratase family protein [Clostridia bacterium]|nr:NAD-dependent epimerase/dehydratase family protein [Clostridia bacterium]
MSRKVLLIGGGGTLGTYTAEELLHLGYSVDVICLEDKVSDNENLRFFKGKATLEFLTEFLLKNHYDGIVNFIHYPLFEEYKPVHKLLSKNTEHLIFLSSYRVYAESNGPITEETPHLLDVTTDKEFLENEWYALSKAKAEKFIRNESETNNWTIVRPVISFSADRLDVVTVSGHIVYDYAKEGKTVYLPDKAKEVVAGLDWAGNSGKLIANLLFKKEAYGEAYTISSAQRYTWGEIADMYTEILGTKFCWIDSDEWLSNEEYTGNNKWAVLYDRFFNREIDNSKVLKVTELTEKDFKPIKEGIKIEINRLKENYKK